MTDTAADILTVLEHDELRLLSWGYVDGGFTRDEVAERIDAELLRLEDFKTTPEAVLTELLDRRLLVEVAATTGDLLIRSRMAETIRLLARLRQLFPSHRRSGWQAAAGLVSDFRVLARPRTFPRQVIEPGVALANLTTAGLDRERRAAAEAILAARGDAFHLSQFQVDTAATVLRGMSAGRDEGTMLTAGTGSGKTLAFYLPALAHCAARGRKGLGLLALYPRVELLRDQLAQALRETDALALGGVTPGLKIGVLYGKTPWTANGVDSKYTKWQPDAGGHVCPYCPCPACAEGDLIWRAEDRAANRHRLVCAACDHTIDNLVLTRDAQQEGGLDLLFTTTEMLNRAMLHPKLRRLVALDGVGVDLVLLDEVHTYSGTHGAHVASLLRRWRAAHSKPVHLVGLSATLAGAREFFGNLTGLSADRVALVEPRERDLEIGGQEYLITLRADPLSGAGVLSTTIQTAMLLARSLDRFADPVSAASDSTEGTFGQRVFAFTDDLDVTNRLYFDLLDAEGRAARNFVVPSKVPLASLRAPTGGDLPGRREGGQVWDLADRIGWPLVEEEAGRLKVGRTSSQDAGVDRDSEVVVATASLEVGFDDDRVGAVLQHKSPHDDAAFVQRKGRAGRSRSMRPWTAIVLSDFGRDRLTYQAYERLFDPELPRRSLPTENPVVLRMQAVFSLLEWLARRTGAETWNLLTRPGDDTYDERNRKKVIQALEEVLSTASARTALTGHLQRALGLSAQTATQLLWEAPRPLLTAVIPTAKRRLESNWLTADGKRDRIGSGPLPEFVVSKLFADLELPEVTVETPGDDEESLRIVQALTAFAPGRVSNRLTLRRRRDRHWIEPPEISPGAPADLEIAVAFRDLEDLGLFRSSPVGAPTRCVRPGRIAVTTPAESVRSSSNASLRWETQLVVPDFEEAEALDVDERLSASDLIRRVVVLTHGGRTPIEARRWAKGVDVELNRDGHETRGRVQLVDDEHPVGIGFAVEVDALAVDLQHIPTPTDGQIDPQLERSLRTARFREDLLNAPELAETTSVFERARLADGYFRALVDVATTGQTAQEAHDALVAGGLGAALAQAEGNLSTDVAGHHATGGTTISEAVVSRVAGRLSEPLRGDWQSWVEQRTRATIGAAVQAALQSLCPEYDLDDVTLDLRRQSAYADPNDSCVYLSEATPGGGGPLQEATRRIMERPWVFSDLIVDTLEPSDAEVVDTELRRTLRLANESPDLAQGLGDVRAAQSQSDRVKAFDNLRRCLTDHGVFVCHPVIAALSARLLRPGASQATDRFTDELLTKWQTIEEQLGVELPLATFAWHAAADDAYERAVGIAAPHGTDIRQWRAAQVLGLLWPRGAEARQHGLRGRNRFHPLPTPDRLLARRVVRKTVSRIPLSDLETAMTPGGTLATDAVADVTATPADARALRTALLNAAALKVESGAVLLSPSVTGLRRTIDGVTARVTIQELV